MPAPRPAEALASQFAGNSGFRALQVREKTMAYIGTLPEYASATMRTVVGLVLALACASGCYARSAQGGGPTIQRTVQSPSDLGSERADRNDLPTAQTR